MADFNFMSGKGSKVTIKYEPKEVTISDKTAFEGHLKKVIELWECDNKEKPRVIPEEKKAKKIEKPIEPDKPKPQGLSLFDEVKK